RCFLIEAVDEHRSLAVSRFALGDPHHLRSHAVVGGDVLIQPFVRRARPAAAKDLEKLLRFTRSGLRELTDALEKRFGVDGTERRAGEVRRFSAVAPDEKGYRSRYFGRDRIERPRRKIPAVDDRSPLWRRSHRATHR